jgi:hypothetical protein
LLKNLLLFYLTTHSFVVNYHFILSLVTPFG